MSSLFAPTEHSVVEDDDSLFRLILDCAQDFLHHCAQIHVGRQDHLAPWPPSGTAGAGVQQTGDPGDLAQDDRLRRGVAGIRDGDQQCVRVWKKGR